VVEKTLIWFFVLFMAGGVDFTIRKWGLDGQTLSSYSYHHSAIRWVLMVKEFPDKSAVQLWSSSDTTIAVALLLDDVEHHEMVSNVHILSGWYHVPSYYIWTIRELLLVSYIRKLY
jgi:hypothetical protein